MKKEQPPKDGSPIDTVKSTNAKKNITLKTDFPLSEKDEVKKAEEKLRKKDN